VAPKENEGNAHYDDDDHDDSDTYHHETETGAD
jgi:hypothetical protein